MFNVNLSEKNDPKYRSLMRVTASLLLLFAFQYTAYAINGLFYWAWRRGFLPATWEIVATELLRDFAVLLAILITLKFLDKRPLNRDAIISLGLAGKECWAKFGLGLGIGTSLVVAYIVLLRLLGQFHVVGVYRHVDLSILIPELLELLGLVSLGVLFEELFFRGYILQTLEPGWGTGFALTFSAVGFGSYHGFYLTNDFINQIVAPVIHALVGGFLMGGAYLVTRTLWLPLGIHFAWNLVGSLVFGEHNYGTHSALRHTLHITWEGYYLGMIPNALVAIGLVCISVRLRRWKHPMSIQN